MDLKQHRLTEAITCALQKHKDVFKTNNKTVIKVLASQLAKEVLNWYKEKDDHKRH